MSGLYIPNIRIPETCSKCRDSRLRFAIGRLGLECPEQKELWGPTDADIKHIRRADCPLVAVPDHGPLKDVFVLKEAAYPFPCAIGVEYAVSMRALNDAPAVIPADKKKEEDK